MSTLVQSELFFLDSPRGEAEEIGEGLYRTLLGFDDKLMICLLYTSDAADE